MLKGYLETLDGNRGDGYGLVIAESCMAAKDAACVDALPVDCVHLKKNTTYGDGRQHSTWFSSSTLDQ